ncbi:MAG: hypothetical protein PUB69_05120 [Desulfovibrionaceae bacterium]|nr:hypothetical protein [Desulfovibrionaceae bacterium]
MDRLLFTLGTICVSLTAGYFLHAAALKGVVSFTEAGLAAFRVRIQRFALFALIPASAMLSIWGMPSFDPHLFLLPLLGLCAWTWGGTLGILIGRILHLNRKATGSLYCCGTFANIGAVGSLVCVVYIGESSIAVVSMYRLFEELFFFSIACPIAQWFGSTQNGERFSLRGIHPDPALAIVLTALVCGFALRLLHLERPAFCADLASGLVIVGTMLFLFAIGLSLKLSSVRLYLRPAFGMILLRFCGVPVVITSLAALLGMGSVDGGTPLKVAAVLSSMPVAMNSLIPPSLYGLDLHLANACWILSTAAFIFLLPILTAILPCL